MVQTTLIILTRNEIEGVRETLKNIPFSAVDEYFAVDYKSTDGTVAFFEKHHIPIVHQKNPGRGEAFLLAAKKAKGKYLIFFSPDGNENPNDIKKIIALCNNDNDLIIASRFMKGSRNEEDNELLKFRKWANQLFSLAVRFLWGGKITDTINGYRGIKKDLFQKMQLDATGFAIEYQMTIRALKLQAKLVEFPTIEKNRIGGNSHASSIPTGIEFLYLLKKEIAIGTRFLKK